MKLSYDQGRPGGVVLYQYTQKNLPKYRKFIQIYPKLYPGILMPEIQRKWYTEYPYLSCNIPYTRFKKPLYTVYPKTLADPVKLISLLSMNLQYVNQQVKPIKQF